MPRPLVTAFRLSATVAPAWNERMHHASTYRECPILAKRVRTVAAFLFLSCCSVLPSDAYLSRCLVSALVLHRHPRRVRVSIHIPRARPPPVVLRTGRLTPIRISETCFDDRDECIRICTFQTRTQCFIQIPDDGGDTAHRGYASHEFISACMLETRASGRRRLQSAPRYYSAIVVRFSCGWYSYIYTL